MLDLLREKAVLLLIAAIPTGMIAALLYQGVKKLLEKQTVLLDQTPVALHRVYFALTVAVMTGIGSALNVPIQCPEGLSCFNVLDSQQMLEMLVKGFLGFLSGLLTHKAVVKPASAVLTKALKG